MDKILKALKCANCNQILSSPVILPCHHSICKRHVMTEQSETPTTTIRCCKCGEDYRIPEKSGEFPVSEALAEILAANVDKLDFGNVHKEAKKSCQILEDLLAEIKSLTKDPYNFIHDSIWNLRNIVQLKEEEIKLRIEEEGKLIFSELDEYEKQCKSNVYCSSYEIESQKFESRIETAQSELNSSIESLNELVSDEPKWQKILKENEKKCQEIQLEFEQFKKRLLLNRFNQMKIPVENFSKVNMDSILKYRPKLASNLPLSIGPLRPSYACLVKQNSLFKDSEILVNKLSSELEELLKLKLPSNLKLALLYRASRDGYRAKDFHFKCNNKRNMLLVIKTTSEHIFGCYCYTNPMIPYQINTNRDKLIFDTFKRITQQAFIFSLLNKLDRPLIFEPEEFFSSNNPPFLLSICHDENFGPKIGSGPDICIADNSNLNTRSFSNLGKSFKHPEFLFGTEKAKNILAGSFMFKVDEIEVFQTE